MIIRIHINTRKQGNVDIEKSFFFKNLIEKNRIKIFIYSMLYPIFFIAIQVSGKV